MKNDLDQLVERRDDSSDEDQEGIAEERTIAKNNSKKKKSTVVKKVKVSVRKYSLIVFINEVEGVNRRIIDIDEAGGRVCNPTISP